jgi:hypothetical protein
MVTSSVSDASLENWERHTQAGFRALSRGLWRQAAEEWQTSFEDLQSAKAWDARVAAAMNNTGVACLLDSNPAAAESHFDKAREAWTQTQARIPELEVPVVGRSSAFHFRLATRHQEAFAAHRRRRCAVLCKAASAITSFNAGLARPASNSSTAREQMREIAQTLVDAFGPRCPEIQLIGEGTTTAGPEEITSSAAARTNAPYGEKAERVFELQARSMAAALSTDYRRLEMATNLTALLSPRLLREIADNTSDLDGTDE